MTKSNKKENRWVSFKEKDPKCPYKCLCKCLKKSFVEHSGKHKKSQTFETIPKEIDCVKVLSPVSDITILSQS
jgi:hypothetical protein